MDDEKEVSSLINLSRKIGQAFCDEDTFEETSSNHVVQKWEYQGDTFKMTFPKTSSDERAIKYIKANYKKSSLMILKPYSLTLIK